MKVRQIKKIKHQSILFSVRKHRISKYWSQRWHNYELYCWRMVGGKCDHRIAKADKMITRQYKIKKIHIYDTKLVARQGTVTCRYRMKW